MRAAHHLFDGEDYAHGLAGVLASQGQKDDSSATSDLRGKVPSAPQILPHLRHELICISTRRQSIYWVSSGYFHNPNSLTLILLNPLSTTSMIGQTPFQGWFLQLIE